MCVYVCVCVCVCVCLKPLSPVLLIQGFLFPSPVPSISWVYKTNNDAATGDQVATFFDGSVLVLQSVTTDNEGTFTCLVGGVANYSATITVNSKGWEGDTSQLLPPQCCYSIDLFSLCFKEHLYWT